MREHETGMPHCWCDPKKEVQPNGSIIVVHNEEPMDIKQLTEQIRLTNLAIKELAKMLESGEWQGAENRVIKIMLDEQDNAHN